MITLHAVLPDDLLQLARGVLGESQSWDGFYRRYLIKKDRIRSGALSELGILKAQESMDKTPEQLAEELAGVYETPLKIGLKAKDVLRFGRRKLGLSDVVQVLRSLYTKGSLEEFEIEFGYVLAQLAHATQPTWNTDDVNPSFLWRLGWEPIHMLAENPVKSLAVGDNMKTRPLETSYSAGIYLPAERIEELGNALLNQKDDLKLLIESKQLPSREILPKLEIMAQAIAWARRQHQGLIEAKDVVT